MLEMKSGDPLVQPPCSNRTTQDIAQGCVQTDFKYFQRGRLHKLPGQSIPGFHPHPNEKKLFPDVQREPPVSQFVPTASAGLGSLSRAWICSVSTLTSGIFIH